MGLWVCPEHGLYGGDVFCPQCGGTGEFAQLEEVKVSRKIHKVILDASQPCPQVHQVPFGAKPLHVDFDNENSRCYSALACWFEVDDQQPLTGCRFWIVRDDEEIDGGQYIGSLVRETMAWHIYMGCRS